MPEIETQLRDYFDATVERITAEDVFAGRDVVSQVHRPKRRWTASPRLAVVYGFAVTVVIVGGSLGLGIALREPFDDVATGPVRGEFATSTAEATGWALLGVAGFLAVVAVVFLLLALNKTRTRARKEIEMATTYDTPSIEHRLEESHRANRWLIAAVVVLAIALVALGAWIVRDLTATSPLEVPTEINAMLDDYGATWSEGDTEAFRGFIREMDYLHMSSGQTFNAEDTVRIIESWPDYGVQVERIGDRILIGDGSRKYVVAANRVTTNTNSDGSVGFSVFTVIEMDDGWKVIRHTWLGDRVR